jgi:hypothetical protein
MQTKTYSRMMEERLIEKFKKEFFSKTGKPLRIMDYRPEGLPFPVISLPDLQSICEEFLPEDSIVDLKRKTRRLEWVYPRMIFCNIAYAMDYSIKSIAEYLDLDRTTIYNAVSTIDTLMSTNCSEITYLYNRIVTKINHTHNESTIPTMSGTQDYTKSAVSDLLLQE